MLSATHSHQSRCGSSALASPGRSALRGWSGCRNAPLRELQPRAREVAEVGVEGDEGKISVDARLRDQHIGEFGLETPSHGVSAQFTGSEPISMTEWDDGQRRDDVDECLGKKGLA